MALLLILKLLHFVQPFLHHAPRASEGVCSGLSTRLSLTYSQHLQQTYIFAFTTVLCQQASLVEAGSSILINNFISSSACLPTHLSLTYPMDSPSDPFPEVPPPSQASLLKGSTLDTRLRAQHPVLFAGLSSHHLLWSFRHVDPPFLADRSSSFPCIYPLEARYFFQMSFM